MPVSLGRRLGKIGAALLIIFLLANPYVWGFIVGTFQYVTVPVVTTWSRTVDWFGVFLKAQELKKQNNELIDQVAGLSFLEADKEQLKKDNVELKSLLNLSKPLDWQAQAVEVLGRQSDDSGTLYLINAGQQQNLQPGLAVVAGLKTNEGSYGGLLVGTIKSVNEKTAGFILTTSPNSRLVSQVLNDSRTQGLAVGEYNLALRIRYLPQDQSVEVGELAVTSNTDPQLPSGLLLGVVSAIEANEGSFFKSAVVTPPVKLDRFKYLYVLKKP
ncbi:rod shape-determining protein MreC [Patescibacteria group bacterium]|nr:rod shape-determining protein MreC [Patescibacteria group bacterium]